MEEPHQRRNSAAKREEGATEAAMTEAPALPASPHRSGRRALVVEADPGTLRLCRDVLESSGFVVDAVDSGIAAVVAARKGLPDLILMDLQLHDVPGREAVGWLRSNPALRSTPIIILTTNAEDDSVLTPTRPGASLRKPISHAAIRRAICELLN